MTKQEYIKQQYGKAWDAVKGYVDENGWVLLYEYETGNPTGAPTPAEVGFNFVEVKGYGWRVDNLTGIEDNNGWIKVEDRLPENEDFVIALDDTGQYEAWYKPEYGIWHEHCLSIVHPTHWRPKVEYPKPLY